MSPEEKHQFKRLEQMAAKLRAQGFRITPQRLAILKLLAGSEEHPTADNLFKRVQKDFPTTSLATVYKTLHVLKEVGEVIELGFSDASSRYDGHKPFPHPHVICTECGEILDPSPEKTCQLANHMAEQTGYDITHHRMDFFGVCPRCQTK